MWAALCVSMILIGRIYLRARDIAYLPRSERMLAEEGQRLKAYHYPLSAALLVTILLLIIRGIEDTLTGLFPVVAIGVMTIFVIYVIYTVSRWLVAEYLAARQTNNEV